MKGVRNKEDGCSIFSHFLRPYKRWNNQKERLKMKEEKTGRKWLVREKGSKRWKGREKYSSFLLFSAGGQFISSIFARHTLRHCELGEIRNVQRIDKPRRRGGGSEGWREWKKVLTQNWMRVIPWLMVDLKFRSVTWSIKSSLRNEFLSWSCSNLVRTYVSRSSSCRAPSYLWILTPSMIQRRVG